jgi:hypothetical protein
MPGVEAGSLPTIKVSPGTCTVPHSQCLLRRHCSHADARHRGGKPANDRAKTADSHGSPFLLPSAKAKLAHRCLASKQEACPLKVTQHFVWLNVHPDAQNHDPCSTLSACVQAKPVRNDDLYITVSACTHVNKPRLTSPTARCWVTRTSTTLQQRPYSSS